MSAALPPNEAERLAALQRYAILDTLPEPDFDALALIAKRICETPIALVSFVDADRQWFKANVGLSATETSRDVAFCAYAILQEDVLIVPDAMADARFATNPLVTAEPFIRFYAGAPLRTPDGEAVGTLCVIDHVPRQLTDEQVDTLRTLSRQIVAQLELRRITAVLARTIAETTASMEALRASEEFKTRMIDGSRDCITVLDLDGRLVSMNAGGMEVLEISDFGPFRGTSWIDFWQGNDHAAARAAVDAARHGRIGRFVGSFETTQTHQPTWFDVLVNAILDVESSPERLLAVARDVTALKNTENALRAAQEGLEGKIQEGTAQLALTNTDLQHEMGERRQVEEQLHQLRLQNEYRLEEGGAVHNVDESVGTSPRGLDESLQKDRLVTAAAPVPPGNAGSMTRDERSRIVSVLKQTNWRIAGPQGAAQVLNLNPSTLRSRLKKLGIQRSSEEFL